MRLASRSALHLPNTGRTRLGIAAGLLAVLAVSNRWLGWTAGWHLLFGYDERDYRRIALAAPHLPSVELPNQHAQVFAYPYLVGLVTHVLDVNVEYVLRAVCLAVILGICICLHAGLRRAGVTTPVYAVCMALFILNTYSLRYYLIVPGYFLDVTFVLTIGMVLGALISGRYWLAVAAIVLGTLARQSAVPVSLALAWWVSFGAGWQDAAVRLRLSRAVGIVAIPVVVYLVLIAISAPFSAPTTPGITGLTIIGDLEQLPSSIGPLAEHLLRTANGLFAVGSLTAVGLVAWRRIRPRSKLPFEVKGCLVVGCSIAGQALLLNTGYSGHPERLAVLSLLPFVLGLSYLLRESERAGRAVTPTTAAAIVAALAAGSLQYLYTVVGPATAAEGAVLQFVAATMAGALLWRELVGDRARLGRATSSRPA